MLILLSPAKSLNSEATIPKVESTLPAFTDETLELVSNFKKLSVKDLEKLMKISPKLAELNHSRFQNFSKDFNNKNSRPALFLFDGDVYQAMSIPSYNNKDLDFAQNNLRILSGLYGILRPLDLMQEYRLEMGTATTRIIGKNLPEFWQEKISENLNCELKKHKEKTIINLASEEYFDAINKKKIDSKIINIIFRDKGKIVGILAKKARGFMADFIIKNKIEKSQDLQKFNLENYKFQKELSDENNFHFHR